MRNIYRDSNPQNPPQLQDLGANELLGFFEELLNGDLTLRIRATGRSMAPFLVGREIVTIKRVRPFSLHIGDLIFLRDHCGFPVLHRIVRKKREGDTFLFQTKGDALLGTDEPVVAHDILGKVCKIERKLPDGRIIHTDMESLLQKIINYSIAVTGLCRSRIYLSLQKSSFYPLLRLIKKTLVSISTI